MNDTKNIHLSASKSILWIPGIIGIALVLSTAIGAYSFYKVKSFDNSLTVTGSAKVEVTSDIVKWRSSFSRVTTLAKLKSGYALMATDEKSIRAFLKSKGVNDNEITISPISMEEVYDYKSDGSQATETKYTLRQQVSVDSKEVDKITSIANDIREVVNQGIVFSTYSLEYYYSQLAEARVNLLSDAIVDAKARAERIAGASGKSVGQLKSASSGVVQVLPLNSVDVSDYGSYATGDIKKEVMVTVKASFTLADSKKIKVTDQVGNVSSFDDRSGNTSSDSSNNNSQVTPDTPRTPRTPDTPVAPDVYLEAVPTPSKL